MATHQVAAVLALILLAAAAATPLEQAAAAFAAHDYRRAHDLWLGLAQAGNAEAAFRLGLLADIGEGEPENAERAYAWFRQAALAGLPEAAFNVAVMKDSGRGTPHDVAGAAAWYGRAAARGNTRAAYDLGLLYAAGDGVPRNHAVARAWFRRAATGGLQAASRKVAAPGGDPRTVRLPPSDSLPPVVPVSPQTGEVVVVGADRSAAFVWTAPAEIVPETGPEAGPVRYFLQVVARAPGGETEIHAGYVDVTAALVRLPETGHAFAWRVFSVSTQPGRYTVTPWTGFSTRPPGPPDASGGVAERKVEP